MPSDFEFHGLAMDANDVKSLAEFWRDAGNYTIADTNYAYVAVLTSDTLPNPESLSSKSRKPRPPRIVCIWSSKPTTSNRKQSAS